ncbi:sigma-70 family RNA polymerase sigma factor [Jannaschia formosa]|uniref:sigma-70 family RNA polymerase sigma factor n=1 Tax=Jannaschia formosa TaxID=2259592 RepID=UPI000E1C12ED|nr:sigma-70 family RNA polymerase sigma factor [Jannaschia formosa]TFL16241.1 sigma-70 family RNA polymerase sigma factor [Jannaschia formosa]
MAHRPRTPTEIETLIARCALGERAAMDALYAATSAKLFGICLRVLNDRSAAEDVLQEVYVKVWHASDRYAANGLSPITWLATIARNAAIDRRRTRSRRREESGESLPEMPDRAPTPETVAIAASDAARIAACMEELEASRAEAVRGAYLDGRSYAELARAAGIPLNTMRTWLRRALISLRECMAR